MANLLPLDRPDANALATGGGRRRYLHPTPPTVRNGIGDRSSIGDRSRIAAGTRPTVGRWGR